MNDWMIIVTMTIIIIWFVVIIAIASFFNEKNNFGLRPSLIFRSKWKKNHQKTYTRHTQSMWLDDKFSFFLLFSCHQIKFIQSCDQAKQWWDFVTHIHTCTRNINYTLQWTCKFVKIEADNIWTWTVAFVHQHHNKFIIVSNLQ